MKGLELSRKFYEEIGAPVLKANFENIMQYLAVGLVGSGSECYGYDDDISKDHDYEPAFCIFIPENVIDSKTQFQLERMYAKLPKTFMGYERSRLNPVGGNRHGVISIGDFFEAKTGKRDGELTIADWFTVPEYSLLESVNGRVFFDNYGELTKIREKLNYLPEDIRLKKLAGNLVLMGQAGQYNYKRCVLRKETAAAQLSVFKFVESAINVVFLLNKKYVPYYKWKFRALRELKKLSFLSDSFEYLISSGNDEDNFKNKERIIENICAEIVSELKNQGLTDNNRLEMEAQAYYINNSINDNSIRNMNILSGV